MFGARAPVARRRRIGAPKEIVVAWLGLAKSQIREQIEKTKRRNKRRRDVSWLVVLLV